MNPAGFSHDQTNVGHQREREDDDLKNSNKTAVLSGIRWGEVFAEYDGE